MKGHSEDVTLTSHCTSEEQWPGHSCPLEETEAVTSCELPTPSTCLITKLLSRDVPHLWGVVWGWWLQAFKVRLYLGSHHFLKMLSKRAFWVFLRVKESLRESILNTNVHAKANYIHKKLSKESHRLSCFKLGFQTVCIWGLKVRYRCNWVVGGALLGDRHPRTSGLPTVNPEGMMQATGHLLPD